MRSPPPALASAPGRSQGLPMGSCAAPWPMCLGHDDAQLAFTIVCPPLPALVIAPMTNPAVAIPWLGGAPDAFASSCFRLLPRDDAGIGPQMTRSTVGGVPAAMTLRWRLPSLGQRWAQQRRLPVVAKHSALLHHRGRRRTHTPILPPSPPSLPLLPVSSICGVQGGGVRSCRPGTRVLSLWGGLRSPSDLPV